MRKMFLVVILFSALTSATAFAGKVETGGKSLHIGGELEIDSVWRDEQFDNVLNNPAAEDRGSDGFTDIEVTIDLSWQFSDNVSFFLQLENNQTNSGNTSGRPGTYGRTGLVAAATGAGTPTDGGLGGGAFGGSQTNSGTTFSPGNTISPTWPNNSDFGGQDITLQIEQAYLLYNYTKWGLDITHKTGLFDVNYDLRGNGTSFLWNLSERFNTSFGGGLTRIDFDNWFVELTAGTLIETRRTGESPTATTDPSTRGRNDDTTLAILHAEYHFTNEKGHVYGQLSSFTSEGTSFQARRDFADNAVDGSYDYAFTNIKTSIVTVAFGGLYDFTDWFQLYGEAALQFGEGGAKLTSAQPVNGSGAAVAAAEIGGAGSGVFNTAYPDEADAKAFAFYVGGNFHLDDQAWQPYLDVSFWWLSGDKDGNANSDDDEEFKVFGNHNNTYIIENIDYGYGINTNYHALKIGAGVTAPEKHMLEGWNFDLMLAWYKVTETDKLRKATEEQLFSAAPIAHESASDNLGVELDLTATYHYSDDLTFTWGSGFLWGADFLAENYTSTKTGGLHAGADTLQNTADDNRVQNGKDSTALLFFDVTLKF